MLFVQRRALPGVGFLAGRILLQTAKKAVATGNHEGDHDPLALLHVLHIPAGFDHFTHKLMTKNVAMLDLRDLTAVEMQIGSTNRRRRDAQDDIVRLFNDGIGNIIHANMVGTVVRECFHATSERM